MTHAKRLIKAALPLILLLWLYSCGNEPPPYQHYKDPITSKETYQINDGREVFVYKDEREFKQALQGYIDDSGSVYQKGRDKEGIEWNQVSNKLKHYRVNITDFTPSLGGQLRVYHNVYLNDSSSTNSKAKPNTSNINSDFIVKPIDEKKYTGWAKYTLKDVGFIYIPKDYSFYDENYYDSISKQLQSNASSIGVIVQKLEGTDFLKITIGMKVGRSGTVHKLSNKAYRFEPVTVDDYETKIKPTILAPNRAAGVEIMQATPIKEDTLNGMFCIDFSLSALAPDGTTGIGGKYYWINNDDRVHSISMSYTSNFYKRHKQVVDKIISSFRITNIR
jgi:hypothetical protein